MLTTGRVHEIVSVIRELDFATEGLVVKDISTERQA
jgi:hypothetical protein